VMVTGMPASTAMSYINKVVPLFFRNNFIVVEVFLFPPLSSSFYYDTTMPFHYVEIEIAGDNQCHIDDT
jgi:hypothetical protein